MNQTKWQKAERVNICYARNGSGIMCRHCSATFAHKSINIAYYNMIGYLCKDCKNLVDDK